MTSNNIKETYGAQNQKDHIETRRLHLVRSKSDQIWMRTKEITESESDAFECQGGDFRSSLNLRVKTSRPDELMQLFKSNL